MHGSGQNQSHVSWKSKGDWRRQGSCCSTPGYSDTSARPWGSKGAEKHPWVHMHLYEIHDTKKILRWHLESPQLVGVGNKELYALTHPSHPVTVMDWQTADWGTGQCGARTGRTALVTLLPATPRATRAGGERRVLGRTWKCGWLVFVLLSNTSV